jgi:hypothetical protein
MKLNQTIINGIVKYINTMYSPKRVKANLGTSGLIWFIEVFFDEDADFAPTYRNPVNLKSISLQNKIRKDVIGFFGVSSAIDNYDLVISVIFE